ncbi:hypothetical protein ABR737_40815 [Streptomyces sp. Edi2]|uniref:hypothetical protein n=1 Tax=Streptomyces sp. Edi2 TaxID=3162528 RepID=UPI003305D0EF
MTVEETPPAQAPPDDAVTQAPPVITVREVPAAADAREALLKAIAAEAQAVTDQQAGQAAPALETLARAYALLTASATAAAPVGETTTIPLMNRAGGHQVGLCLELEP